jgi:hypothetical protein
MALYNIDTNGSQELKTAIGKVLLACAHVSDRCFVTVMKDLSRCHNPSGAKRSRSENKNIVILPSVFDTRLLFWDVFTSLVNDVLVPLASMNIVHADIRFDPRPGKQCICNILGERNNEGEIDLRLVDYESLVYCKGHAPLLVTQPYAISVIHFQDEFPSAFEYLFWQVLWVAYLWSPTTDPGNVVTTYIFVNNFFSDDQVLDPFKRTIGNPSFTKKKPTAMTDRTLCADSPRRFFLNQARK